MTPSRHLSSAFAPARVSAVYVAFTSLLACASAPVPAPHSARSSPAPNDSSAGPQAALQPAPQNPSPPAPQPTPQPTPQPAPQPEPTKTATPDATTARESLLASGFDPNDCHDVLSLGSITPNGYKLQPFGATGGGRGVWVESGQFWLSKRKGRHRLWFGDNPRDARPLIDLHPRAKLVAGTAVLVGHHIGSPIEVGIEEHFPHGQRFTSWTVFVARDAQGKWRFQHALANRVHWFPKGMPEACFQRNWNLRSRSKLNCGYAWYRAGHAWRRGRVSSPWLEEQPNLSRGNRCGIPARKSARRKR